MSRLSTLRFTSLNTLQAVGLCNQFPLVSLLLSHAIVSVRQIRIYCISSLSYHRFLLMFLFNPLLLPPVLAPISSPHFCLTPSLFCFVSCRLEHIDVQNEHTHGLYYEQKLQDKNITKNFYRKMRACDNTTKLFFNDYQAIDIGPSTEV